MSIYFSSDIIEQADGIELSTERYNLSNKLKTKFDKEKKSINFINKDILSKDISLKNYDIIYTSNLCFNKETNKKLSNKLANELKNGSYIFASKKLVNDKLKFEKEIPVEMTWNKNHYLKKYIKI